MKLPCRAVARSSAETLTGFSFICHLPLARMVVNEVSLFYKVPLLSITSKAAGHLEEIPVIEQV